jgi:hypothetical protein
MVMFKKLESRRRKQTLKDAVNNSMQKQSSAFSRARFAAELSLYEPPTEPVTTDDTQLPELIERLSAEESETLKSINKNFREGMSITKLIAIAKAARHSLEEKEAFHTRTNTLLAAIELDHLDPSLQQQIREILQAEEVILDEDHSRCLGDGTSSDTSSRNRHKNSPLAKDLTHAWDKHHHDDEDSGDEATLIMQFLSEKPTRHCKKTL